MFEAPISHYTYNNNTYLKRKKGGCTSVVESLPTRCKALGSSLNSGKKKKKWLICLQRKINLLIKEKQDRNTK
jgi:hypothetical protein